MHTPSRGFLGLAAVAVASLAALPGCSDGTTGATSGSGAAAEAAAMGQLPMERQLADLVAALTDDSDQSRPGNQAFVERVQATLRRMEHASPDLGLAVLGLLTDQLDAEPGLRLRLLESAALATHRDEAARALLASELARRIEDSRFPMGERNKACELIGRFCPSEALAVLGPIVAPRRLSTTTPDHEFVLRGYLAAADQLGTDTTDALCAVASELSMDTASRVLAFKTLAGRDAPRALATMEDTMVESTGDSYVRRAAVNAYVASVPKERAIERLEYVLVREADPHFQIVLQNTVLELKGLR
jgi:hypothetical protein